MTLLQRMFKIKPPATLPNEQASIANRGSEIGVRATPENELKYMYRQMWVDPDLRQAILDVREADRLDGRVKRVHSRIARDVIKGGLLLQQATENKTLAKEWQAFGKRLQLDRREKLKSDARGFVMEGNLPMQWVMDKQFNVIAGVRMPSETILPNVNQHGQFKDVARAYSQFDILTGAVRADFAL